MKYNKILLSLFLGIFLFSLVSASQQTINYMSAQTGTDPKTNNEGPKYIVNNNNVTIDNVTLFSGVTATKVYVQWSNHTTLYSSSVSGGIAVFSNAILKNNTVYYVVAGSDGSTYTEKYQSSNPVSSGSLVNVTHDYHDNSDSTGVKSNFASLSFSSVSSGSVYVNLTSPFNSSVSFVNDSYFNSSINSTLNLTNSTFYFYYQNGTILFSSFLPLDFSSSQNISFYESNIPVGSYYWNIYVCGNSSINSVFCNFSSINSTFYVSLPYSGFKSFDLSYSTFLNLTYAKGQTFKVQYNQLNYSVTNITIRVLSDVNFTENLSVFLMNVDNSGVPNGTIVSIGYLNNLTCPFLNSSQVLTLCSFPMSNNYILNNTLYAFYVSSSDHVYWNYVNSNIYPDGNMVYNDTSSWLNYTSYYSINQDSDFWFQVYFGNNTFVGFNSTIYSYDFSGNIIYSKPSLLQIYDSLVAGASLSDLLWAWNPDIYLKLSKSFKILFDSKQLTNFPSNFLKFISLLFKYIARQPASLSGSI